jgi:hypothetical protein
MGSKSQHNLHRVSHSCTFVAENVSRNVNCFSFCEAFVWVQAHVCFTAMRHGPDPLFGEFEALGQFIFFGPEVGDVPL